MVCDHKIVYRKKYKRFEKLEQVCQVSSKNWNKIVMNCQHFETLSKSIIMVRYVFKFSFMRCSGLLWEMCKGFVG